MRKSRQPSRPKRSRRTHPVRSSGASPVRWWEESQRSSTVVEGSSLPDRCLKLAFPSGDPLDHLNWLRPGAVVFALLMPLVFIARIAAVRSAVVGMLHSPKAQAAEWMSKGQPLEAIGPLKAALSRHPDDSLLLRQLALAEAATAPSDARRCYNRLEKLDAATDEDRARHSILLSGLQDLAGAKAVLSKISPDKRSSGLTQQAWLELWRAAGDFAAAAEVLDSMYAARHDVALATCLNLVEAASRTPSAPTTLDKVEKVVMKELAATLGTKPMEVKALAPRLASINWHSTEARRDVAGALRSLPGNPSEFRMAAVRLSFPASLDGNDRTALRKAWLDEVNSAGGLSAAEKDRVAAYLQKQREHELVVDLIPAAEAVTEYPLFVRRVDSLLELGRWREVGVLCADPTAPSLLQSRLLTQSLAALYKQGPQTFQAERLLMNGLYEARDEKRAAACFATGCAALDHRLNNLAGQAFAAALDLADDRRATLESIINSSRHGAMNVAQLLGAFDGTDALHDETVQNQLIYLNLLAGRDLDTMREVIHNRRSQAPDETYLRFLEAFALHLRGDYSQAAQLLVPLPRYRWHQGEAAVIASIVAAAGKMDRSAGLLSRINTGELFTEERSMVEPWKQKLASSSPLLSKVETANEPAPQQ